MANIKTLNEIDLWEQHREYENKKLIREEGKKWIRGLSEGSITLDYENMDGSSSTQKLIEDKAFRLGFQRGTINGLMIFLNIKQEDLIDDE